MSCQTTLNLDNEIQKILFGKKEKDSLRTMVLKLKDMEQGGKEIVLDKLEP